MLGNKRARKEEEEVKDTVDKRPKLNMREGKVDFKPEYEAHRKLMKEAGCDVERMIKIR